MTRRWMKPVTFTANPNVSVGAPWEIVRAPSNRTSFIYAKLGDVISYSTIMGLIPDYDVGFTILLAGAQPGFALNNREILASILLEVFFQPWKPRPRNKLMRIIPECINLKVELTQA